MLTQEQIIELAKDVELHDSIDWTNLNVERDKVYQIIGSQVFEEYYRQKFEQTQDNREAILLATIVKLVVENFVLNLKILGD